MPFASALSEHPVTAHAVGEVAGQVLERIGQAPELALLFVTPPHAGALEDAAAAVRSVLLPDTLLGCAAVSVVANGREVESTPAVTLWAGRVGPVVPMRLTARPDPLGGTVIEGWPDHVGVDPSALLLLADPFSFPVDELFELAHHRVPGLPIVGGMASAARGPGGNRIALDGAVHVDGAVGVLLGPAVEVETVVSQGCRPVGQPLAVTKVDRNIVYELGGRPAFERLLEMARNELTQEEVALVNAGHLHVGRVIDEHKAEFSRGDFLVRNVLGADESQGAIAVNDTVELGATVQFHLRDARSADEDLRHLLAGRRGQAEAGLLFTCNGRGQRFFGEPDHDAGIVANYLDHLPVAGFFAAGEFGPVGGRNFVHGFTASMALLRDRRGRSADED